MPEAPPSPWFRRPPSAQARIRLVCFHHAGGSAQKFLGWSRLLPDCIDPCPVHLPGRGARFPESSYTAMADLVADLTPALAPLCDRPVALLGHSMGAGIAFATAHAMALPPVHLFAGKIANELAEQKMAAVDKDLKAWRGASDATDFAE